MMEEMRPTYSLPMLCKAFAVSQSGYFSWRSRPPSARKLEDARLAIEIRAAHRRTRESYGPERLQSDLADHGVSVGVWRLKRLRHEHGIRFKQKKKFRVKTDSDHNELVAPNLLDQGFMTDAPNQVWLTDITPIPTDEGWLYLAGHKDLCTGAIKSSEQSTVPGGCQQTAIRRPYSSFRP